jgi:DNA-directed RNA polymerase specialized sigma24 family protein
VSNPPFVENLRDWLSGIDQVQRYVAGAVTCNQRRYGPLPFQVGPDDVVQEVFVDLIAGDDHAPVTPVRKNRVAEAVKRVLRRYRDRKYQRKKTGLPEIHCLDFDPLQKTSWKEVEQLAGQIQADLGPALTDEEALIWHKLATEGNKTVREIAADLGIRHQRVSEIRRKLEKVITTYLLSVD